MGDVGELSGYRNVVEIERRERSGGLQPVSTKAQPTSIGKSHRPSSGVLPQGHTPGPGPGGQQNSRSFAAALRNLAKQAGPAPQEEEPRVSPKNRAPPPLVRGPSPAKERSTHERRPEEIPSLYTTARPVETSKHSVTAAATELLARSGFQPYRPEHHPAHPPAFALDPATYSAYHPGLYPPPHLPHAYRLEEQLYLERCGMIRPPLFPGLPSYPLYGLRYSPDMLPPPPASLGLMSPVMHERLKLEEEHRLRQAREQAALREEEERRRAVRNSAPAAPVPAPAPAPADTAARKPTIAVQLHSDRDRERDGRERQSGSGGGGGNNSGGNVNNIGNICGNSISNSGNSSSNISGSTITIGSNHHQSRKEEQQSSAPPAAPPPPPSDPTIAAAVTIYHPRLTPFPNPVAPIGPTLGSTSICSVSSAHIPPPLGSTLPPLNLGPPPPAAISSTPICPAPIPAIPSLPPGVIGPPPPSLLYKPPHFSTSSLSSSSSHQQHHSQSKLNVPTINTSNSSHSSSGGTSTINSTNSNITKQQNAHHIAESHQTTTTTTSRNDSSTNNCVSSEKTMTNSVFNANNQVNSDDKIANHTNVHHKSNSDIAPKDNKLNACNEKTVSENIIRQPQLSNQNHVATNSVQEKTAIPHLPYEQQGKTVKSFHPVIVIAEKKCEKKNEIDCTLQCDQNNVLSTLPFQPSFKFSINDIAQKPMDTTQLMQSIQSEEVLRTCQNVSNVLLQIPKYQEKLLNFSTSNNELKTTAICITDKCNNLTEISVRCEPAVLNVPDLSKALSKQDVTSNEKEAFLMPDVPKEISTLDLAEKRRKRRREKNTGVICSSDSEGEEETKDMDFWITKGPPAKLQFSEDKLAFLAMFGLTTLTIRNEIELCKVEKRYRINPEPPEVPLEVEPMIESVLPIPSEHPDCLLHTPDFEPKVGFLRNIGLDIMPPKKRDEAEVTWQHVLADRKKRKSVNSVTAYCENRAKVYSRNPPALPKPQKMRLLDKVKAKHIPERPSPLPPLVPGENGVKQYYKTTDINESTDINENIDINKNTNTDEISEKIKKPRWTGIVDVMFAYSEYLKEKSLERKILTSETSKLKTQSNNLCSDIALLEQKMYDLLCAKTTLDSEKQKLSDKIERIKALVRNLR
ncbi:Genetic suppressor element 1 [Trachymyrmex cornetzi]|uniref:Genetic suppressor element 1 n=1 Tax=Trachymyrmex cornetzi TaxID=471704 RepID=A0A151ITG7_9HYME|nr:Genetic suppressor element 1 [Trachymyrmex cornetzi]